MHYYQTIKKPIFIIGCPRSGTTLLYRMLSRHPQLCWFTQISDNFPRIPIIANIIYSLFKHRTSKISQGEKIWGKYCKNNVMTEADLTVKAAMFYRNIIEKHLNYFNKPRFINKLPVNCLRIRYINSIFPNSIFIHIVRDGRAVALSAFKYSKEARQKGEVPRDWITNELIGHSLIEYAKRWKNTLDRVSVEKNAVGAGRFIEVKYEDLTEKPVEVIGRLINFCNLDYEVFKKAGIYGKLIANKYENRNYKWVREVSDSQKTRLENEIKSKLVELNYDL